MKVTIEEAKLKDGIIYLKGHESKFSGKEVELEIQTRNIDNYKYIKDKLLRYPWAKECRTWGEVIKKIKKKTLDISIRFLVV